MVATLAAILLALVSPPPASAANCSPVVNPYAGSRYEGIDLRRIRAVNVNCDKARDVVRKAHRKGLLTFEEDYKWHAWEVRSDLSGSTDQYRARRSNARISWVF